MAVWLIEAGTGLVGFLCGVGLTLLVVRMRRRRGRRARRGDVHAADYDLADLPAGLGNGGLLGTNGGNSHPVSSGLVGLLGGAIREPLRQLRRSNGCPETPLRQLEHIAWQARMLAARPRPMQSKLVSPVSLLQEAAEDVALLEAGVVGASWSLLNRQPVQVDPERARAAFREIIASSAEICGEQGRLGIRILTGSENGYPVQIEVEIGKPGAEADPLGFVVARHLLEGQGARVEVDGGITRIHLRGC